MPVWVTALWTTVAGGVIVVVFQRTWKGVSKWQDNRRTVDQTDRKLLYEMRDVMMDRAPGMFTKGGKGLVTQVADLNDKVISLEGKVDQVLARLPELPQQLSTNE